MEAPFNIPVETREINGVLYYLPATNDEVIGLVNEAHRQNAIICMRGAAHSFPLIGNLETQPATRPRLYLMLSNMCAVTIDDTALQVTAQGGCHLGPDPHDPTHSSTLENSLLYQLDQRGLAIPDLGGITHQTVGGFLSTGSSGGSTHYSFDDQLVSITMVTGGTHGARLQTFSQQEPGVADADNPFFAAGVALGLFGVIVSATFNCVEKFNIAGQESTTGVAECPIDLFGETPGRIPFSDFLRQTAYTRLMWWPQQNLERMVVWQAHPIGNDPDFLPIPYEEVPFLKVDILSVITINTPIPAEVIAGGIMKVLDWLRPIPVLHTLIPTFLKAFVQLDGDKGPQKFQDVWFNGIPMDNQMDDNLMPVWFTELWIPIDQATEVMKALRSFYQQGLENTGTFSCEIYASKASRFWLSPSYQTDVIRIDVFWFAGNEGKPTDTFFPKFWNLLQPFNFRPHWGKYLPDSASAQGASYLRNQYPNFDRWLEVREQMDPNQLFVSDYWRNHLGISPLA